MKPKTRLILSILAALLAVLLIGPFLVPVPDLDGLVPPETLADADSQFAEVAAVRVHYKSRGTGEPSLVLLHGFGASTFSWREVLTPLAQSHTVVAFDRPAFGLTERPLPGEWSGASPYGPEKQVALTLGLMDELGLESAVLVGNSAGGTVAALTALEQPDRVTALILVDPAIYGGGGSPALVRPLLRTPQMRHLGPLIARRIQAWGEDFGRSAWHDPAKIPPEFWDGYRKPLQVENWDRALWELTVASKSSNMDARLDELTMPVLVITGDDDRIVPTEDSVRLAGELPNAELAVLADCGHIPQEECPAAFLDAATAFLASLPQ